VTSSGECVVSALTSKAADANQCVRSFSCAVGVADTLSLYADFFIRFGDFRSYVNFFLFDNLDTDGLGVGCFMPFDDFCSTADARTPSHSFPVPSWRR